MRITPARRRSPWSAGLVQGDDYLLDRQARRIDLTADGQRRVAALTERGGSGVGQHAGAHRTGAPGPDGGAAVRARGALPGPRRQGADRGRVHRPHHGGPVLERRAAADGGGEGGLRAQPQPHLPRAHHLPALLRPLPPSLRHERHGGGGRGGVARGYGLGTTRIPTHRPAGAAARRSSCGTRRRNGA